MTDQTPQQKYQVRFDWGVAGFTVLAPQADVVILVDVLPTDAPLQLPDTAAHVMTAGLTDRTAVAEWVLARQAEKGDRFSVAVVAAGAARADGNIRFAVEDLLAAGAVIDALIGLGIDHCSPEAAAASAAFVGLKQAARHLVSASESGQQLVALGREAEVRAAAQLDVSSEVAASTGFAARS
ncbi:2-phosphosulfolactate phosphatase [Cryobacterium roopkundense]|uniref:Probable 2-phosphosulfolactate phosphatase n=1 Tax=Cryobacterium roopkundense TaxID=1001240 RepID=A0A7W8ZSN9_9MICO|nr:2-phosphosulfolactate phosphatase [Cryobacterium roopkundense]MBB5639476.1 2-phosphosulfolactate phosphatase [Cryobacterium roopkundense]